jgi:hypothetical protein
MAASSASRPGALDGGEILASSRFELRDRVLAPFQHLLSPGKHVGIGEPYWLVDLAPLDGREQHPMVDKRTVLRAHRELISSVRGS